MLLVARHVMPPVALLLIPSLRSLLMRPTLVRCCSPFPLLCLCPFDPSTWLSSADPLQTRSRRQHLSDWVRSFLSPPDSPESEVCDDFWVFAQKV